MDRPFVIISGLPGSGKTTLGRRLAPVLNLPLIDKDDVLDRLFESKGIGDSAWRRTLSRESDLILQREAMASAGAVLASFWRRPGMADDSGTATEWLQRLSNCSVNVHCICSPELAARRFVRRKRHPGHLDGERSYAEVLSSLQRLHSLGPPHISLRIEVNTSQELHLENLVRAVRSALGMI